MFKYRQFGILNLGTKDLFVQNLDRSIGRKWSKFGVKCLPFSHFQTFNLKFEFLANYGLMLRSSEICSGSN